MPYKISGTLSDTSRIIIIKESDWSIESNTNESVGAYEVDSLAAGAKWVVARKSDGEALGYGSVTPEEYTPPERGVFAGGSPGAPINIIEYVTIATTANAQDFGDLNTPVTDIDGCSNGSNNRGLFGGGYAIPSRVNSIDYITISTPSDATDFGDLSQAMEKYAATSNGINDRGCFGNGDYYSGATIYIRFIDYVAISTTANALDFGDLSVAKNCPAATSNGTNERGVWAGGYLSGGSFYQNIIDYVTISTPSNSTDFGDLLAQKRWLSATSNSSNERGVFGGGQTGPSIDVIEYITLNSLGNGTDFGDLSLVNMNLAATSNGINDRGIFAGGTGSINIIEYITISSPGDATDFGDLTVGRYGLGACSNA